MLLTFRDTKSLNRFNVLIQMHEKINLCRKLDDSVFLSAITETSLVISRTVSQVFVVYICGGRMVLYRKLKTNERKVKVITEHDVLILISALYFYDILQTKFDHQKECRL